MASATSEKLNGKFIWSFVRIFASKEAAANGEANFLPPGTAGQCQQVCRCIFCGDKFNAAITRVGAHIGSKKGLGKSICKGVTQRIGESEAEYTVRSKQFREARARVDEFAKSKTAENDQKRETAVLNVATSDHFLSSKRNTGRQSSITTSEIVTKQRVADETLARAFYCASIPPYVLRNEEFRVALQKVALVGPTYTAPSEKNVGGDMIDAERERISKEMAALRPSVEKYGTTIVSDGASDINRRPILNLLNVSPHLVEFACASDCSGLVKDAPYIAGIVISYVLSLPDPRSVVQVIMDNATRASWVIIEEFLPWVTCSPCSIHVDDLELGDFVKRIPFFKEVVEDTNALRKFIRGHSHVLSEFKEVSGHVLVNPGATRMCTVKIGLESMKKSLDAVNATLTARSVMQYVQKNKNQRATPTSKSLQELHNEARAIAGSIHYSGAIDLVLSFMNPVCALLRLGDSDKPVASKIQYSKFQVQEKLKAVAITPGEEPWDADSHSFHEIQQEVIAIHRHRWDYGYSDIQGCGYLLDPEYVDMNQEQDDEIMQSFRQIVDKTFQPLLPRPCVSVEIAEQYSAELSVCIDKRAAAEAQLMTYKNKRGAFARASVWVNAQVLAAADWWSTYGSPVPELQTVACRATAQISSIGSSERAHKVMGNIETKKRNRLGWDKVESLIYIQHNTQKLKKAKRMDGGVCVIPWTEGTEDIEWVDAWREGAEEHSELDDSTALRALRVSRTAARAERMAASATIQEDEPDLTASESASDQHEPARATRGGRVLRRPDRLRL
ncbi:hypothetical protein CYMTET_10132 [Cymbomonas tetramitiformis]|uniref:DUF659 domain-containing protein n=1 Tax=Cymbomonas tetramitiformis TaxID=36881 RepID=A0AAE0L385_9CHLO|nr:hypothetical protein CYMTET_21163 [Cymbomonas tetramitiformis]KAK3282116.1 hypothetical protein CYMTET_10132 [Cymbomonas tetramitiformis]